MAARPGLPGVPAAGAGPVADRTPRRCRPPIGSSSHAAPRWASRSATATSSRASPGPVCLPSGTAPSAPGRRWRRSNRASCRWSPSARCSRRQRWRVGQGEPPARRRLAVRARRLVAAITGFRDTGGMPPLTPAERQARRRARLRASEAVPCCSSCGAKLQPTLRQRPDRQGDGLCWECWILTPAGLAAERERGQRARAADPDRARQLARERARQFRQRLRGQQQGQGAAAAEASQDSEAQG